jgi:thiamine kinase-like enzyme
VNLTHTMLLSFGGHRISHWLTPDNSHELLGQIDRCLSAIHKLGVVHNDVAMRNVLYLSDTNQVMLIDFEGAIMRPAHRALGEISPIKKRKSSSSRLDAKSQVEVREHCETNLLRREFKQHLALPQKC